jgi:hypothetical protein
MYHDYLHRPSGSRQLPLDAAGEERIRECLPRPQRLVQFASSAFSSTAGA